MFCVGLKHTTRSIDVIKILEINAFLILDNRMNIMINFVSRLVIFFRKIALKHSISG